jgi:anti-sigma-K factor RskA
MSDDNEMDNEKVHDEVIRDGSDQDQRGAVQPFDDVEPLYDVAGAALGALSPSEEADLYTAASLDHTVSAELAAMEAVCSELARLSPVQQMSRGRSAGIRSRLVTRAEASQLGRPAPTRAVPHADHSASRPVTKSATPSAHRPAQQSSSTGSTSHRQTPLHVVPFEPKVRASMGRMLGTLAIAAALLIAAFGVYSWRTRAVLDHAETASAIPDSSLEAQVAELHASVAQKDSLIAALTGMHTRVIDLANYSSTDPMARVFWDQKRQMFFMYASNLKRPPAGKTYQVWLIARGKVAPVSAGTFMPESDGSAIMSTRQQMEPGSLRRIAVTEEPTGGVPAPTGAVVFAGVGK